ncbi:MAG: beta-ketoacyl-ACP reductase [Gammaproteobacteria bacterium]|nr:beta-ketoacyl-ACP reductase [Gammaproteobacteria bacterium]
MSSINGHPVAVITGGARGIGRAITRRLATDGFHVVINYTNSKSAAEALTQELSPTAQAIAIQADVRDFDQVAGMIDRTLNTFGRIDVLINNAGVVRPAKIRDMTAADWNDVLATCLTGSFYCSKCVIDDMLKKGFGRIINMSSTYGLSGSYGQTNYSAAKAGIIGFTKALALEMAKHGITVNAIAPGLVDTDMAASVPEKIVHKIIESTPVKRLAQPPEIAGLVSYLASTEASYVTGQVFAINGGLYM